MHSTNFSLRQPFWHDKWQANCCSSALALLARCSLVLHLVLVLLLLLLDGLDLVVERLLLAEVEVAAGGGVLAARHERRGAAEEASSCKMKTYLTI